MIIERRQEKIKILKFTILYIAVIGLIFACKAKETEITKAPSKETEQVQVTSAPIIKARAPLSPETLPGTTVVDSEWVKANYQKIKVYDPRTKAEYAEDHIPGAIFAPYIERSKKSLDFDSSKDEFDISKFPTDKNTPIILYGNDQT